MKKKQLMNKQGKSIRELMTDTAIPPLARRKLQQAFAIIQRASNLTTPDNEPTCEHCGASIPKPPKPPKKYTRKKRDRKRMQADGSQRHRSDAKKRRLEASKLGHKMGPVNLSRQSKGSDEQSSSQSRKESEPQRSRDPFPRNLYHSAPGTGPLERMIINAPGMAPPRELPPSLQFTTSQQEDWASGRSQQIPATPAAVAAAAAAAAARGVYPNHGAVDIMWQPGQPTSGWQHEEVRNQATSQQQQQQHPQHGQRNSMVPPTSSAAAPVHIGQPQVSHTYY